METKYDKKDINLLNKDMDMCGTILVIRRKKFLKLH